MIHEAPIWLDAMPEDFTAPEPAITSGYMIKALVVTAAALVLAGLIVGVVL